MNSSVEWLTPHVGRLFRLRRKIDNLSYEAGDIFLLTGVEPIEVAFENLSKKDQEAFEARVFAHYPNAVICHMLCGEQEHRHACAGTGYFYDYFELIEGV